MQNHTSRRGVTTQMTRRHTPAWSPSGRLERYPRSPATTISTRAGSNSALTCVRVLSTTCSPSLRSLGEIATGRSSHVDNVAGPQMLLPVRGAYDEPSGLVDVDRLPGHLAPRHGHLHLLAGGRAQPQ